MHTRCNYVLLYGRRNGIRRAVLRKKIKISTRAKRCFPLRAGINRSARRQI